MDGIHFYMDECSFCDLMISNWKGAAVGRKIMNFPSYAFVSIKE
jgi:hypothetical protein